MNPLLSALVQAGLMDSGDAARIARQLDSELAREHAEAEMLRAFQVGLSGQRDRLLDAVRATDGLFPLAQQNRLWAGENERLWASVRDTVLDVASERAVVVGMGSVGPETWNLVNEAVIDWAETYYIDPDGQAFGSIPNLNLTSRTAFERAFVEWQRGELVTAGAVDGLPQLIRALEPTFGAARAEVIGITETTRVHSQAILQAARANPFVTQLRWLTSFDERTCPVCAPLNGQTTDKNGEFSGVGYPPAHVRCRCRITEETAATVNVPNQPIQSTQVERVPFVPTPVAETAEEAPAWSPSMNRATADRWAANSVYKDDTYHITPGVANERSIKASGFDMSKSKFGRMWGDGVYVGTDGETANMYQKWTGPGARELTLKLNIQKPFVYQETYSNFKQADIVLEMLGLDGNKAKNRERAVAMIRDNPRGLTGVLSDAGYDALHIKVKDVVSRAGGNQLVVFDPKNVTVLND